MFQFFIYVEISICQLYVLQVSFPRSVSAFQFFMVVSFVKQKFLMSVYQIYHFF